jgi:hypothetical protein
VHLITAECTAWQSFFNKTGGQNWFHCKNALTDPCSCTGERHGGHFGGDISCGYFGESSRRALHLTGIVLSNNLAGPIPGEELSKMTRLTRLLLFDNELLSGTIPLVLLSKLSSLTWLDLLGNRLTGSIPDGLLKLTKLTRLNLGQNSLSGNIPDGLWKMKSLEAINLRDNLLTGTIASDLSKLTVLSEL